MGAVQHVEAADQLHRYHKPHCVHDGTDGDQPKPAAVRRVRNAQWQQQVGEDVHSLVQYPGFKSPAYPGDDYSLPNGTPGVGFVVFDPTQAGRTSPLINPPAIPATFATKNYDPATDF